MSDFDDFDGMRIPLGGAVPFEPGFMREEQKPDIRKTVGKSGKGNSTRNFNESPLTRLYCSHRISETHHEMAKAYMRTYYQAYPTQSHEYMARVDGSGSKGKEYSMAAKDRILACGRLMDDTRYKALQMLLIDRMEPSELSARFGYGWGVKSIDKRIGEVLDELSQVWGQTKGFKS